MSSSAFSALRLDPNWKRWMVKSAVGAMSILTVLYLCGYAYFGSTEVLLAFCSGESLAVIPATIHLGDGAVGEVRSMSVKVTNLSAANVTIVGAASTCQCALTSNLPATIEGGCSKFITLQISFPKESQYFSKTVTLFTSSPTCSKLPVVFSGRAFRNMRF
jgi:hypothetical protein